MSTTDPEELAEQLEREADRMQAETERLRQELSQTRAEWERKRADPGVPGALPPEKAPGGESTLQPESASDEDSN